MWKNKKFSYFYDNDELRIGKSSQCKKCVQENNANWLKKNKRKWTQYSKERKLKIRYNVSVSDYNIIYKKQNGVCAICNKKESSTNCNGKVRVLSVDHNHSTGKIRGLLCARCNQALGLFQDNPKNLKQAIKYLEK